MYMKCKLFSFLLSLVFIYAGAYAQDVQEDKKIITGTVTSADGTPLIGVTVLVTGSTIGTTTDINGKYTIKAPSDSKDLVFRFIGFQTIEVPIESRSVIDVTLAESTELLEELIVHGAAAATPIKKMSFAVAKLSSKNIAQVPATTAAGALQGKIAGVSVTSATGNPGNAPAIRLRGSTSLLGSQAPLYIIDGVYLYGTLADIGINDIENIEVIKGASGSSLYGSRAGNGVIVWSSYRGSDLDAGRTKVRIRNEFGRSSLARKLKLSNYHYFKLEADGRYTNVKYNDNGDVTGGEREIDDDGYADNRYSVNKDHQSDFFKPGNFYINYISVANKSSNGRTNLYASFENNKQDGIVFGTKGFGRQSFRFNADHKISEKFSIRSSNYIAQSNVSNPPGGVVSSNGGASQGTGGSGSVFYDLLFIEPDVNLEAKNDDGTKFKIRPVPWTIEDNPLYPLEFASNDSKRNRIMSNIVLSYIPVDWLDLEVNYSVEKSELTTKEVYPKGYLAEDNSRNGGELRQVRFNLFSETFSTTANFHKKFGDFTTKLKLSYFYENFIQDFIAVTGTDLAAADVDNLAIAENANSNSGEFQIKAVNYFGILDLDYQDKYIASFLYRIDGSSLFGADVRYQPYFRTSLAYRLTEDIDIPGINELKLRFAYGTAGQRPGFDFQYETYSVSSGGTISKNTLGNSDLKPSRSTELEVGTNIEFLDRFKFEMNYATTTTEDVFGPAPLSASTGYSNQFKNIGTLTSNVIEFGISSNIIRER